MNICFNNNEERKATGDISPTTTIRHIITITLITTKHKLFHSTIFYSYHSQYTTKTTHTITIDDSYPITTNTTNYATTKINNTINTTTKSRLGIREKEENLVIETKVSEEK